MSWRQKGLSPLSPQDWTRKDLVLLTIWRLSAIVVISWTVQTQCYKIKGFLTGVSVSSQVWGQENQSESVDLLCALESTSCFLASHGYCQGFAAAAL